MQKYKNEKTRERQRVRNQVRLRCKQSKNDKFFCGEAADEILQVHRAIWKPKGQAHKEIVSRY